MQNVSFSRSAPALEGPFASKELTKPNKLLLRNCRFAALCHLGMPKHAQPHPLKRLQKINFIHGFFHKIIQFKKILHFDWASAF